MNVLVQVTLFGDSYLVCSRQGINLDEPFTNKNRQQTIINTTKRKITIEKNVQLE